MGSLRFTWRSGKGEKRRHGKVLKEIPILLTFDMIYAYDIVWAVKYIIFLEKSFKVF